MRATTSSANDTMDNDTMDNDTINNDTMNNDITDNDNSTTAKLASAAHAAVDIAAANLELAEQALREARIAAGQTVNDGAKQAQSYSEDAVATVKAYIDLYPLRSVGIALAAGFLLSSLLKK